MVIALASLEAYKADHLSNHFSGQLHRHFGTINIPDKYPDQGWGFLSWAAVTPVKFESESKNLECTFIRSTRTTKTPAFWRYPLRHLMVTHTIKSYWIPSQKKTKSKLQISIICQNFWLVLLKIQSRHDSVHRRTDQEGETSISPFQLRWIGV